MTIYVLMQDGTLPGPEVLEAIQEFLRDEEIRPMTDLVTVEAPAVKTFDLGLTYYIARSNQAQATAIQAQVDAAIQDFVTWQTTEIGRDINPSELVRQIRAAGAKRVELTTPAFEKVADTEVAQLGEKAVVYGGLEDA